MPRLQLAFIKPDLITEPIPENPEQQTQQSHNLRPSGEKAFNSAGRINDVRRYSDRKSALLRR